MFRVLLAAPLDAETEARLRAAAQVVRLESADQEGLCRAVADCDALIARTHTPVTRRVLAAGRRLRVVGVAGVGLDHVDVAAAEQLGIRVISMPEAASDAVAELTVELMLQLLRPVPWLQSEYAAGRYVEARAGPHGRELRGLTIGIVGMGRIGSRVGRICAAGFGANVLYNDIADVGPFDFAATPADKPTLWAAGDLVTLHVPLTDQTRRLVNASVLSTLRPSAYLINTARGEVVDTDALVAALRSGRLAGAALDVTDPEPLPPGHPLFACDNCILTPHIAARTHGGLRRMYAVVDAVLDCLRAQHREQSDLRP